MTIYWQGWASSPAVAYIELILHAILVLLCPLCVLIYVRVLWFKKPLPSISSTIESEDLSSATSTSPKHTSIQSNTFTTTNPKSETKEQVKSISKLFQILLLCSMIMMIINIYGHLWISNLSILIFNIRYKNHCFYRVLISSLTVAAQKQCLYLFFLTRIKQTFDGSIFQLSPITYYLFVIVTCVITFGNIYGYCGYTFRNPSFLCSELQLWDLYVIITYALDILLSAFFTFIMIYKLKQATNIGKGSSRNITNSRRNDKINGVRLKLFNLSMVCIISTIILQIVVQVGIGKFGYAVQGYDMIINNICIMFAWKMFQAQHDYFCKHCLRITTACCACKCACKTNKMENNEQKIAEDIAQDQFEKDIEIQQTQNTNTVR